MDKNINHANIKANDNLPTQEAKRKKGIRRYVIYFSLVLVATGIALFLALYKDPVGVFNSLKGAQWQWVLIIVGVVALSFVIDALVLFIFMRLYTRKYHIHQGLAVSMIGSFYSCITPGAKGGQVPQAYALKNQGTQISNAASILVMYFILYQIALVIFNFVAVIFNFNLLSEINSVPLSFGGLSGSLSLIPLTIIGFVFSLSMIAILFLMSYSHRIHNFIMHYGVGFLARIKILKHPDKTRESLRIQVDNFKIELRRLLSNIPVTILILVLFFFGLMCEYSIPWFAGMAVNGFGYYTNAVGEVVHTTGTINFTSAFDACFLSCYHQMVSGLIPIPGGAGISEILFAKLFENYYCTEAAINASLILWRASTFYLVMIVCGFVTAILKASPKKQALEADRRAFVTMQLETYDERKQSSDDSFENTQASRKEAQARFRDILLFRNPFAKNRSRDLAIDDSKSEENSAFQIDEDLLKDYDVNKKKHHAHDNDPWSGFSL